MPDIPRERALDSTVALAKDPYRFLSRRARAHGAALFEARILLEKTLCLTGPEAAELFYDTTRFRRQGAMPMAVQKTLLGVGGVQGLDAAAHRHRKQLHLGLMTRARIEALVDLTGAEWRRAIARWQAAPGGRVTLYPEFQDLLTRAVCAWAGVNLPEGDVRKRTRQLSALFDHAATPGPAHLWSRWARRRVDAWLAGVVTEVRAGRRNPAQHTAAHAISWHRDLAGELLAPRIAAVELANVLRPTVALAVYLLFVAHALVTQPASAARLRAGDEAGKEGGAGDADADVGDYPRRFVQEVRRWYPFFPAVAARTCHAFVWQGYTFPKNRQVMLDLYGINHDPRTWADPDAFSPDRFLAWDSSPYNFTPQGGGTHDGGHRCAGEWLTLALMRQAATVLARDVAFEVPAQDLDLDWGRMPAVPKSRLEVAGVRAVARPGAGADSGVGSDPDPAAPC